MRKLLIITPWFPSELHPIEGIFVKEQALALATHLEVAVFVPQASRAEITPETIGSDPHITVYRQHCSAAGSDSAPRSYEARRSLYRKVAAFMRHTPLAAAFHRRTFHYYEQGFHAGLRQVLADFGTPDVIHAHVSYPTGAALVGASLPSAIPRVLTEHASNFAALHLDSKFKRRAALTAINRLEHIIAVSESLAAVIREHGTPQALSVVGNIVDTGFFTPSTSARQDGPFTFLAVGSLSRKKGLHILLEAASELLEQGIDRFRIRIAGDGPEEKLLTAQIEKLDLAGHVTLLGRLFREEVRAEMQRCDCFAMPSLNESFGIVFAEAMACGKPVIATRCGGPENFVTPETGILLPAGEIQPLVAAMGQMLSDELHFDPQAIRDYAVARFSPEIVTRDILAVYEQAIAASRS